MSQAHQCDHTDNNKGIREKIVEVFIMGGIDLKHTEDVLWGTVGHNVRQEGNWNRSKTQQISSNQLLLFSCRISGAVEGCVMTNTEANMSATTTTSHNHHPGAGDTVRDIPINCTSTLWSTYVLCILKVFLLCAGQNTAVLVLCFPLQVNRMNTLLWSSPTSGSVLM